MSASSTTNKTVFPVYMKYMSANVLGMIGFSCYILADTFFIARGIGADALAALNLALPAYSLMNGTGLMIGMGGAARFSLSSSRPDGIVHRCAFTQAFFLFIIASILYTSAGLFFPETIARILGADRQILPYAADYLHILLSFSPLFLGNNLLLCFVRNDGAPQRSMTGMLIGSLSNIVLDYFFIFIMHMGMTGAAIATATAPIVSMFILSGHFLKGSCHFKLIRVKPSAGYAADICSLGISSLITELSSGIVIAIFNYLILSINGNTGVAAYGILANIALVLLSVYTGIAQGIQPLVSKYTETQTSDCLYSILRYAIVTALIFAGISYTLTFCFSVPIAELFNRDHDPLLTEIASDGMKIYFLNLFFSGINIIAGAYLSSADRPKQAFAISILRGVLFIIPVACVFSRLWGLQGIWMSVPVTEILVCILALILVFRKF